MSRRSVAGFLLILTAVTATVWAGYAPVSPEYSLRLRVFDPKYDSPQHGKGVTVNSTLSFRPGQPIRLVNGGQVDVPGFDEPQTWGTTIDADARLQANGTALVNIKLETSSLFDAKHQKDVHLVDGQVIRVCCPVTLGKPRTIQCSDGRSLEILVTR